MYTLVICPSDDTPGGISRQKPSSPRLFRLWVLGTNREVPINSRKSPQIKTNQWIELEKPSIENTPLSIPPCTFYRIVWR